MATKTATRATVHPEMCSCRGCVLTRAAVLGLSAPFTADEYNRLVRPPEPPEEEVPAAARKQVAALDEQIAEAEERLADAEASYAAAVERWRQAHAAVEAERRGQHTRRGRRLSLRELLPGDRHEAERDAREEMDLAGDRVRRARVARHRLVQQRTWTVAVAR